MYAIFYEMLAIYMQECKSQFLKYLVKHCVGRLRGDRDAHHPL